MEVAPGAPSGLVGSLVHSVIGLEQRRLSVGLVVFFELPESSCETSGFCGFTAPYRDDQCVARLEFPGHAIFVHGALGVFDCTFRHPA